MSLTFTQVTAGFAVTYFVGKSVGSFEARLWCVCDSIIPVLSVGAVGGPARDDTQVEVITVGVIVSFPVASATIEKI